MGTLAQFVVRLLLKYFTSALVINSTVILDNATFTGLNSGSVVEFLGIPFAQPPYVQKNLLKSDLSIHVIFFCLGLEIYDFAYLSLYSHILEIIVQQLLGQHVLNRTSLYRTFLHRFLRKLLTLSTMWFVRHLIVKIVGFNWCDVKTSAQKWQVWQSMSSSPKQSPLVPSYLLS